MFVKNVFAENFLSFETLEYNYKKGSPVMIQGVNNDEDSEESNGSGKSTLQTVLEYSLLQSTPSKDRDVNLIRWGCDEALVGCEVYCETRKETLSINRLIPKKGSTKIEISINNEFQKIATVADGNEFILNWLDITKEDLQNYYIVNKFRYKSFFYSSNKEKIELIGRFSNNKIIDGVFDEVQKDIDKFEDFIEGKNKLLSEEEGKIKLLNEQIEELKNKDHDKETQDKISDLKLIILSHEKNIKEGVSNLSEYNDILSENKELLRTEIINLKEIKEKLIDLNKVSFEDEKNEINKKVSSNNEIKKEANEQITPIEDKIKECNEVITVFENILSGVITCPECNHKFLLTDKISIEEAEEKIEEYKKELNSFNFELEEIQDLVKEINSIHLEFENKLDGYRKKEGKNDLLKENVRKSISSIEGKIDNIKKKIEIIQESILKTEKAQKKHKESILDTNNEIEKLKNKKFNLEEETKPFLDKINVSNKEIERLSIIMCEENKKLIKVKEWYINFSNFRSHLARKSLLYIQNNINNQLDKMKSNLRLLLEGFKLKADKTLKEEITPYIIKNGNQIAFKRLSGGQRVRMDVSSIITMQEIINSTNKYGGLDYLHIDEITESSDALGMQLLLDSLKNLDKTILITSHVPIKEVEENILTIIYENGRSKII
jgi:exonuclease SbcC